MTQETALDILKLGHNVYLTGAAGSGKTYVLNQYIKYLRDNDVEVGVTASTGIAATHMGGVTIHSWTGLGIRDRMHAQDISSLLEKQYLYKRLEKAKVLIIDEVSMLHHYRLDLVDQVLKAFKHNDLPFGGIQVILCGDFFQLPPISRKGEQPAKFIYHSKVWREAKFKICYLEEQHRQTDDISLRILNDIRNNEVSEDTMEHLKARFKKGVSMTASFEGRGESFGSNDQEFAEYETSIDLEEVAVVEEEEKETEKDTPALATSEPTRLFTHNINVDSLNDEALDRIEGEEFEYYMESHGSENLVEILKKSCLAPEMLRLKIGAKVMFVKNNFEAGYVNGTLGVVVECDKNNSYTGPTIKISSGELIQVEPATWSIEEDGKVKAEIIQYPLRLAWAITIHKSQGMSLDAVEVDLSKSFERGMGYVALSRVRSIEGLTILGLNDTALRVHDEVLMIDEKLRIASDRAVSELDAITDKGQDIERLQQEFLKTIAPSESERRDAFAKKNKISTFDQTRALVEEKKKLKDIAKERNLTEETIIEHIEKLIDEDPQFRDVASYLLASVPYKKQDVIRDAFAKAYPDLAKEAGEPGTKDYRPDVYSKCQLSPVKHKVLASISYKDIRLVRALG